MFEHVATSAEEDLHFGLGNRLCVDFANLALSPGDASDHAPSWDELIDFFAAKQIVSLEKSATLRKLPESDVRGAEVLLCSAVELNRGLRQIFRAMVNGQRVAREWTEPVNRVLRITEGHDELKWDGSHWRLSFVGREEGLEWLLAAIARSGAELIAEGPNHNLRRCGNARCPVLFYDHSKTQRRRWCSMALCGNRSKVAAFARRHMGEKARAHHA